MDIASNISRRQKSHNIFPCPSALESFMLFSTIFPEPLVLEYFVDRTGTGLKILNLRWLWFSFVVSTEVKSF